MAGPGLSVSQRSRPSRRDVAPAPGPPRGTRTVACPAPPGPCGLRRTLSSLQPQGCHSLEPRDGTPVSQLGPLVRKQAGSPRPLATARRPSRPATRPPTRGYRGRGGPEWRRPPSGGAARASFSRGYAAAVPSPGPPDGGRGAWRRRRSETTKHRGACLNPPGTGGTPPASAPASTTLPVPRRARLSRYDLA